MSKIFCAIFLPLWKRSDMKFTLISVLSAVVLAGCYKAGPPMSEVSPQDKSQCRSVSATGWATFTRVNASAAGNGRTLVAFTWVGQDGTVYDTREYGAVTNDQCVYEKGLQTGFVTRVQSWVQCPARPANAESMSEDAVSGYTFSFPDLNSRSCTWTIL